MSGFDRAQDAGRDDRAEIAQDRVDQAIVGIVGVDHGRVGEGGGERAGKRVRQDHEGVAGLDEPEHPRRLRVVRGDGLGQDEECEPAQRRVRQPLERGDGDRLDRLAEPVGQRREEDLGVERRVALALEANPEVERPGLGQFDGDERGHQADQEQDVAADAHDGRGVARSKTGASSA